MSHLAGVWDEQPAHSTNVFLKKHVTRTETQFLIIFIDDVWEADTPTFQKSDIRQNLQPILDDRSDFFPEFHFIFQRITSSTSYTYILLYIPSLEAVRKNGQLIIYSRRQAGGRFQINYFWSLLHNGRNNQPNFTFLLISINWITIDMCLLYTYDYDETKS